MLLDSIWSHKGARPLAVVICTGVKTLELLIVDNIHTFELYSGYMHNKNTCINCLYLLTGPLLISLE